jgi:small subunit ribosomal protein S16
MLIIRLSRVGKKKQAQFRIVISEKEKDTHGDFLELLGTYNPHKDPGEVKLKEDRVKYWLSKGAQVSGTIHNILVNQNILSGPKRKKGGKKKKTEEEKTEAAEGVKNIEVAEGDKEKKPEPKAEEKKSAQGAAPAGGQGSPEGGEEAKTEAKKTEEKPEAQGAEEKKEEPKEEPKEAKKEDVKPEPPKDKATEDK